MVRPARGAERSTVDIRERVDVATVAQHFEMHVGPGRSPGRAKMGDRLPAAHGIADANQQSLVVRIAGDVPVAVGHVDHLTVTGSLASESDDAGTDRQNRLARRTREIDAAMKLGLTRKRILPKTEYRGEKAARHRPTLGLRLPAQIALQNEAFKHAKLRVALRKFRLEGIEHSRHVRNLPRDCISRLGPAGARQRIEGEFVRVEIRHFDEALAERIEANYMRVDLTDAGGDRIHPLLYSLTHRFDFSALLQRGSRKFGGRSGRQHLRSRPQLQAGEERPDHQQQHRGAGHAEGQRTRDVDARRSGSTTKEQDEPHARLRARTGDGDCPDCPWRNVGSAGNTGDILGLIRLIVYSASARGRRRDP